MRQIVFLSLVLLFTLVLSLAQKSYASVSVNVSGNGENTESRVNVQSQTTGSSTICVNGKCTTNGGKNNNTVCVNGKCYTTEDDVNIKTEDGKTEVKINNDTNTSTVNTSAPTVSPTIAPTGEVKGIETDAVEKHRAKVLEGKVMVQEKVQEEEKHFNFGAMLRGVRHLFFAWMF